MIDPESKRSTAILTAHARYALALLAKDEIEQVRLDIDRELASAEAELRALARRK